MIPRLKEAYKKKIQLELKVKNEIEATNGS